MTDEEFLPEKLFDNLIDRHYRLRKVQTKITDFFTKYFNCLKCQLLEYQQFYIINIRFY